MTWDLLELRVDVVEEDPLLLEVLELDYPSL
jgi:hypothetical protein